MHVHTFAGPGSSKPHSSLVQAACGPFPVAFAESGRLGRRCLGNARPCLLLRSQLHFPPAQGEERTQTRARGPERCFRLCRTSADSPSILPAQRTHLYKYDSDLLIHEEERGVLEWKGLRTSAAPRRAVRSAAARGPRPVRSAATRAGSPLQNAHLPTGGRCTGPGPRAWANVGEGRVLLAGARSPRGEAAGQE